MSLCLLLAFNALSSLLVSHILPGGGGLGLRVPVILLAGPFLWRAGAAQEGPPQHGQAGRRPAHEQSRAKLIPIREVRPQSATKNKIKTLLIMAARNIQSYSPPEFFLTAFLNPQMQTLHREQEPNPKP